tara:strand:- start:40 stop:441 length:402 start_codon:yes stop_codon:yes gene_type:complete
MSKRSPSPHKHESLVKRVKTEKTTRVVLLGERVCYERAGQSSDIFYKILITTKEAIEECECNEIFSDDTDCMSIDGTGGTRVYDEMKEEYGNVEKLMAHADSAVLNTSSLSYCLVGTMYGRSPPIPWREEIDS